MSFLSRLCEKKTARILIMSVLALLAAVSVFAGARNALEFSQDFQWDAAKALSLRLDPYELSKDQAKAYEHPELSEFYRMFTDRGLTQKMEANQFPSLLMLLWPMTVFAPQAAKTIWLVLNLLFTAGIIWLLRKTFFEDTGGFEYAVISLLMLAGTPYRNQIGVGQHTLFAFFFFMLAVYVERKKTAGDGMGNSVLISLCLFVSYFKYTLTAPLALYFLYKKKYTALALSAAMHVVLTEAAALWLGKSFIYMIKAPLGVASALASEGGIDLGVILGGGAVYAIAALIAAAALVVMTFAFPADKEYVLLSILICASLILTYHRTYDFFVLSAAAMFFCRGGADCMGEKERDIYFYSYAVLLAAVYFGLRLFNENDFSKAAAGIIYYAYTAALVVYGITLIRKNKNERYGSNHN